MLSLIIFITMLIILLLNRIVQKNAFICAFTTFIWCISLGLSSIGFAGLYPTSVNVCIMALIYIIVFFVGTCITSKLAFRFFPSKNKQLEFDFSYERIMFFLLPAWIYSLLFIPKAISLLNNYGYAALRSFAFNASDVYMSVVELLVFQCFIEPIYISTNILFLLILYLKRNYKVIPAILINFILYSLLFGGRSIIVNFISVFIFLVVVYRKINIFHILVKNKKIIISLISIVGVFIYMVSLRKFSALSPLETILIYLSGPFSFFDQLLSKELFPQKLLYGKVLFGAITSPISYFIRLIYDSTYQTGFSVMNNILQEYITIGENIKFNALATILYPAICDFSYLGIIIYPLMLGGVSRTIEIYYFKTFNYKILSIYLFIASPIMMSTMNFYLSGLSTLTSIFVIIHCFKRKRESSKNGVAKSIS